MTGNSEIPDVDPAAARHARVPKLPPPSDPRRLLLALWGVTVALLLGLAAIAQWLLLPSYLRLETEDVERDLHRVRQLLAHDAASLGRSTTDHAFSDDTVAVMADGNAAFASSHLLPAVFASSGVSHLVFMRPSGEVRFGASRDAADGFAPLDPAIRALAVAGGPLVGREHAGVTGLIEAGGSTYLVASRPVLARDRQPPAHGWVAMLTRLGPATEATLSGGAEEAVRIRPPGAGAGRLAPLEALDARRVRGRTLLPGVDGRPAGLLEVTLPREVYRHGLVALGFGGSLVLGLLLVAATLLDRAMRRLQHSQEEHRALEARHLAALENAAEGMLLADARGLRILDANRAARRLLDLGDRPLAGLALGEVLGAAVPELPAAVELARRHGQHGIAERSLPRADGTAVDAEIDLLLVPAPGREFFLVTLRDLTARNRQMRQMRDLAYVDTLTGLPNRANLQEQLHHHLGVAERERWEVAFLFLDLDRFKNVNDTLGHDAGDELLTKVAQRLALCVREGDMLARLGGDEFALVLYRASREEAGRVGDRIRDSLLQPIPLRGRKVHVAASIGIARYPDDGTTFLDLSKAADIAMYRAKRHGGGYAFYARDQDPFSIERLELESELRSDLAAHVSLVYQPIVDLHVGAVTEVEALLRWHRRDGRVEDGRFVVVAEEVGLGAELDRFALTTAVAQAVRWRTAGRPLRVAVNVSAQSLCATGFADEVTALLAASSLPADGVTLEVTETALLDPSGRARPTLEALAARGVRIALDDFGSGYSSLADPRSFHVDAIKLDRALVDQIGAGGRHEKLVARAIALGHRLGIAVVAAGVETAVQLDWLRARGCGAVQGYLCGRPRPAAELDTAAAVAAIAPTPSRRRPAQRTG